jgi:hypothetical protein
MKPDKKWMDDWMIGVKPVREKEIASELIDKFLDFWDQEKLDEKSKTTMNRYAGALHALGGFLVERAVMGEDKDKTADELLREHIDLDEGPLIYHDNEEWQTELDMVCRKLFKYLKKNINN